MSKVSKIIFIIGFLLTTFLYNNFAFATTANMNLSTSSTTSSSTTQSTTSNTTKSTSSAQYSTAASASNFDLHLTNILSICLIVVGVLLILLAIAILIRLKN